MSDIDWNKIAENAANQTDVVFQRQLAGLTSLKITEIDMFITESKISNTNAVKTLKIINDATMANNKKAIAISNIDKGFNFLIKVASKVLV